MQTTYYLDFLNTSNELYTNKPVFLCIYTNFYNNILYILEKSDNIMFFPHFNSDDNIIVTGDTILKNKLKIDASFQGTVPFDNYYYVFYRLKDNYNYDKLMDTYLFSSIYEITFQKKILNYKIHNSVSKLFFKYKLLNYLYDSNEQHININDVVLYKCANKDLYSIVDMGIIQKYHHLSDDSISTSSDFYNLLQEYLIKENISFKQFINKYSSDKELSMSNLKTFIMSKGLAYNEKMIKSVFKNIDINNDKKLSASELSDIFRDNIKDKKDHTLLSSISTFNKNTLTSGNYIRIIINLRSYNIVGISKKHKKRDLQISEPFRILSGTTL